MDAFLSYEREDADVGRRLAGDLERAGVTVWSSLLAIRPGDDWAREIEKAISEARIVLFIVPDRADPWQSSKIALAVASQRSDPTKRIVPILAHPSAEIPFFLRRYQVLDLSSDTAYKQGLAQLVRLLREAPLLELSIESDRARAQILSVQRKALRQQQAELTRESRASHVKLIASIVGAALTVVAVGLATFSVFNLGWIGERSITTLLAVMFGVLGAFVGISLARKLSEIFTSLFGSSERGDE